MGGRPQCGLRQETSSSALPGGTGCGLTLMPRADTSSRWPLITVRYLNFFWEKSVSARYSFYSCQLFKFYFYSFLGNVGIGKDSGGFRVCLTRWLTLKQDYGSQDEDNWLVVLRG